MRSYFESQGTSNWNAFQTYESEERHRPAPHVVPQRPKYAGREHERNISQREIWYPKEEVKWLESKKRPEPPPSYSQGDQFMEALTGDPPPEKPRTDYTSKYDPVLHIFPRGPSTQGYYSAVQKDLTTNYFPTGRRDSGMPNPRRRIDKDRFALLSGRPEPEPPKRPPRRNPFNAVRQQYWDPTEEETRVTEARQDILSQYQKALTRRLDGHQPLDTIRPWNKCDGTEAPAESVRSKPRDMAMLQLMTDSVPKTTGNQKKIPPTSVELLMTDEIDFSAAPSPIKRKKRHIPALVAPLLDTERALQLPASRANAKRCIREEEQPGGQEVRCSALVSPTKEALIQITNPHRAKHKSHPGHYTEMLPGMQVYD